MNKLICILVLGYFIASCGAKKPLPGFEETTIFKFVEERTRATRFRGWQAEIHHVPLTNSHFVYRNYDVYFVFHSKGRLARVLLPHTEEPSKSGLTSKDRINGTYFQRGSSKVLTYQYYDAINGKMKKERSTFKVDGDTLLMDQGSKLLVRLN